MDYGQEVVEVFGQADELSANANATGHCQVILTSMRAAVAPGGYVIWIWIWIWIWPSDSRIPAVLDFGTYTAVDFCHCCHTS